MKRDKLYVANKWNLPSANVFDLGGDIWSQLATEGLDPTKHSKEELANLTELYKQDRGGLFNMTKEANPFSKGNLMQAGQGLMKGLSGGLSAAAGNMIGGAIADGYSAGSGVGAVTGALQGINLGNPALNAIKNVAVGTLGGVFNRGFGIKANEANIATIKQSAADKQAAAQEMAGADTTDDLLASAGSMTSSSGFSAGDLYKNGWWTNKGTKKGQALINTENTALAQQNHALGMAAGRVDTKQDDDVMTNFAAFGGLLPQDDSWGMAAGPAIDYGFKSDLLGLKKKQIESRGVPNILYALGGDVQTHGGDFSTGLTSINAGGLHEENPNEGVQMGVDEQGIPNLVEEGEVIWNDYVFSNRIELDEESKKKFHFPKKKDITFADAAKKLEAEISERPNDPISRAGFKAQMEMLAEEQERQKAEMEAQRAEEAFNALSDEEKVALMQQAAQQEQMLQEEAIAEQQEVEPAQGAGMEGQVSPEEAAMMEQQAMQADGSQAMLGQEAPVMAEGGHLYAGGSKIRRGVYKALGFHTDKEFLDWARKHKLSGDDKWELGESALKNLAEDDEAWKTVISDPTFAEAVKDNPALAHALGKGYDFGKLTVNNTNGYDLPAFNKVLEKYTMSKRQGNTKDKYAIDDKFGLGKYKTIKDLENSENYQAYTKYLTDMLGRAKGIQWRRKDKNVSGDYDNIEFKDGKSLSREDYDALLTLAKTAEGTSTKDKGKPVPIFDMDGDEDGWYGLNDDAVDIVSRLRGDQKGGIFHLTPEKLNRGQMAQNWVINDDGSVEEIIGDVPTDWTAAGNYSWATPENDMTYNYYRRPVTAAPEEAKTPEQEAVEDAEREIVPDLKKETSFGMLGPWVNLGLMAAGVGKPDTSGIDAAVEASNRVVLGTPKHISGYYAYKPMDIWYEQNRMDANARATDRAIVNNAAPIGTKIAGLLASGYNNQIADSELYRKALDYNNQERLTALHEQKDTDKWNAAVDNDFTMKNAAFLNDSYKTNAGMRLNAAQQKLYSDAQWYNSLYGNVNAAFDRINQWEKWKRDHNTLAKMYANGLAGVVTPDTPVASGYVKYKSANGGKLKKKKSRRGNTDLSI